MQINGDGGDLQRTMDRVLIGDGTDAENAIVAYWNSLRDAGTRAHPPIGMLHLDPARPRMLKDMKLMRWSLRLAHY